jgi:hypothetical protein
VGALLKHLDLETEIFEGIVEGKRGINEVKYPLENFEGRTVPEALQYCRDNWNPLDSP